MRHTHFHPPSKKWFSLDECEKCGAVAMAANAVGLHNPEVAPGLIYWNDELPPELGYDDSVDLCVCDDCYDWNANKEL